MFYDHDDLRVGWGWVGDENKVAVTQLQCDVIVRREKKRNRPVTGLAEFRRPPGDKL